jgi:hypothetical protein
MKLMKEVRALCTPAFIYFVISAISYVWMVVQNIGNTNKFCLGKKSCAVPSTLMLFVGHAIYIAAWTFGLNWLCSEGYTALAWILLFVPIILLFTILGGLVAGVFGLAAAVTGHGGNMFDDNTVNVREGWVDIMGGTC